MQRVVELRVCSDRRGVTASAYCWWLDNGQMRGSRLLDFAPIDVETGEEDVWVLISGLYRQLAHARQARPLITSDIGSDGAAAPLHR